MSPTFTPESTDRILAKMRKTLGLPQIETAQRAGIEPSKYSRWESSLVELSREEFVALRDVIDQVIVERSEAHTLPPDTDTGQRALSTSGNGRT